MTVHTNGTTNGTPPGRVRQFGVRAFSALVDRFSLVNRIGSTFDHRRQMHEILGYKRVLDYRDFKAAFLRQDIAQRLVKIYPEATWAQPPTIYEDDETDTDTPFEVAWETLATRLQVYATLARSDLLANLGQYAVLLIGLRGQSDLRNPARAVRSADDVLYLEPYSEEWASIHQLDGDPGSPTFGKPLTYRINFNRSGREGVLGGITHALVSAGTAVVHASRVIHLAADDLLDDTVFGIPWLEPLYDVLTDFFKTRGGWAEMAWRDGKRRIALELQDGYRLEPDDETALTEEVEEYVHDFKDFLRLKGVTAKDMSGTIPDLSPLSSLLIDVCCAVRGVPKRILMGSERGELASSQDERAWKEKVSRRQQLVATPRHLCPLIDRLLLLRALPTPLKPYCVEWDNLLALSEQEQADIALKRSQAIAAYAGPGFASQAVPEPEWREQIMGLPPYPDVEPLDLVPRDEGEQEPEEPRVEEEETDAHS